LSTIRAYWRDSRTELFPWQAGEIFSNWAPSGTGVRAGSRSRPLSFPFSELQSKGQLNREKKGVHHMNQLIPSKNFTTVIISAVALVCIGFLPQMQAVSPPPDGGYPNFTTAEGQNALFSLTTGSGNTGVGWRSLFLDTSGNYNTGLGAGALALNTGDSNTAVGTAALLLNTTGFDNVAVGTDALVYNDSGSNNNAVGAFALYSNTTGLANTAEGAFALYSNTTGGYNTANGTSALYSNTIGLANTADGAFALYSNTTGGNNAATGSEALYSNTTGSNNTAHGTSALINNTTGLQNTANGASALYSNTTGNFNTANGINALYSNTTGSINTATGDNALYFNTTGIHNTANGEAALYFNTTGSNNTALGDSAGESITGSGNVCIGQAVLGEAGVSDRTYIRNVNTLLQDFSAGVNDYVTVRLSDGRLGHTAVVSSRRYKQEIKPLAAASQALYALKPVSFRLKKEFDPTQALGFGLIAEEVEQVDPALVYRNAKGQVESVRYEMVNAMLLNEFLKEHRRGEGQDCKIQEQETTIAELRSEIRNLAAMVNEQASDLRKVSAQLRISNAAVQAIASNSP
jgi:hypothetical protein